MKAWFALGIFLLGAGIGALITAIAYWGWVHRVRNELQAHDQQKRDKDEDSEIGAA